VATIRDVARLAGVSIATVSRAFNGSSRVSDETRRHVHDVAARIGYWPNTAARSLTTSRTLTIGVLLPDLYGEFFSEVIRGIDQTARAEGYQILVSSSHADAETLVTATRSMRGLVDGIIVMAPHEGASRAVTQISENFIAVLLNPRVAAEGCPSISIANYDGAYAVVTHLLKQGHRVIATVKGPAGNVDAEERLRGYRAALRDAGVDPSTRWEIPGDFTESSGHWSARQILRLNPRPTAVAAANDYMAVGLMSALRDAGIRMPEEMAVTGFDDIAIAQFLSPPLTTVHVDAYGLGERAVRRWLALSRSGENGTQAGDIVPTQLVVRRSCGAPRPQEPEAPPAEEGAPSRTAHAQTSRGERADSDVRRGRNRM